MKPNPPKSSDYATIMYTSGTTGKFLLFFYIYFIQILLFYLFLHFNNFFLGTPKGVLLTHGNLMSEISGILKAYNVPSNASYLSFLPLAHIFERIIILACIHAGGRIGFFHGVI